MAVDVQQVVEDCLLHYGERAGRRRNGNCRREVVDEEGQRLSVEAITGVAEESNAGAALLDDDEVLR